SCMVASELYPALCIPDDARKGKMLFMQFDPENIEDTLKCKLFRFSPEYPKSASSLNIYEIITKIPAPILIIHGSKDGIVNIDYAKRAREKAVNANSRLIILDGAKHGFNKRQIKIANEHIKAFLNGNGT
ncbi:MAG: alpha/beta hydrolase, partial [Clostridia bacterium]|nr:alpha/beta hydrolase [Clostridia bacterium]